MASNVGSNAENDDAEMEYPMDKYMAEIGLDTNAYKKYVTMALWDHEAEPGDSSKEINTFVVKTMYEAATNRFVDWDLFKWFKEEFEDWSEEDFVKIKDPIRKKMKAFLMKRGIFVDKDRHKSVSKAFIAILEMDGPPEWPEKELQSDFHHLSKLSSQRRGESHDTGSQQATGTTPKNAPSSEASSQDVQTHVDSRPRSVRTEHQQGLPLGADSEPGRTQIRPQHHRTVSVYEISGTPEARGIPPTDLYEVIPPMDHGRAPVDPDLALKFSKAWKPANSFSGEESYDLFDDKVRIFLRTCRMTRVQLNQCWAVFHEMLSGEALDYYNHLVNPGSTFCEAYWAIKNRFDTAANQQLYYVDWTQITLSQTRREEGVKSWTAAVSFITKKLHLCQRALGKEYAGDTHICSAVVRACSGSPEFAEVFSEPVEDYRNLSARLQARAAILDRKHTVGQYLTEADETNGEVNNESSTHFTDRRFVGRTNRNNRPPLQKSWRRQNRGDARSRQRGSGTGKCWICKQDGCRSYKHSQREQNKARDEYEAYKRNNGGGRTTDNAYMTFLMKWEGDPATESADEEDTKSDDEGDESEAYYMAATLQDQAFMHRIGAFHDSIEDTLAGSDSEPTRTNLVTSGGPQKGLYKATTAPSHSSSSPSSLILSQDGDAGAVRETPVEPTGNMESHRARRRAQKAPPGISREEKGGSHGGAGRGKEDCQENLNPSSYTNYTMDQQKNEIFQGILPDTGAARVSTVGRRQLAALQRVHPEIKIDESRAGEHAVRFGDNPGIESIGTATVKTPVGTVDFHVMDARIPFLLSIKDMDKLGVYLNNVKNQLVKGNRRIPIYRRWGHPWFFLDDKRVPVMFLTEIEMRRVHRRFGHPSVDRLHKLLHRAGHDDVGHKALAEIEKDCHHCQMNGQAPRRFKFTLTDDREFNFEIVIDVMYLDGAPVLHIVDWATSFQAARFLRSMSAKDTWEALRAAWIDTYLGPPDIISHDAGTNFAAAEFKAEARMMGIRCHQVPVEAHSGIGKVERYHAPLRRAYGIISAELGTAVSKDVILQMALKAVNDTAGPDGIVPTVLVFGAYPRIVAESPPSALTIRRAQAMKKAMGDLRNAVAERRVNDALNTRNGPIVTGALALAPGDDVKVWREKEGWTGPHKVISVDGHNVIVNLLVGNTEFRVTSVQPYFRSKEVDKEPTRSLLGAEKQIHDGVPDYCKITESGEPTHESHKEIDEEGIHVAEQPTPAPLPRRRGRPRGSKNKPKIVAYLSKKEIDDLELAVKLRREGKITTDGAPFELSSIAEIDGLIANGTFRIVDGRTIDLEGQRIFKTRLVNEIKGKNEIPYEKSRLVVQGYNDAGKDEILTQSPTIQRASQRLLISLIPTLLRMGFVVEIRDITQAYTQATTRLQRLIIAHLPKEMRGKYPQDSLLIMDGPLYGIPEAGVHWFGTYHTHHIEKLGMETSTYDPCLLVTTQDAAEFGLVGMQTDDTLIVSTEKFSRDEQEALDKAKFKAKPKTRLGADMPLEFNGARITMDGDNVMLRQKGQAAKIKPVTIENRAQEYVAQRARGAYLASICQPEAAYDLAVAAQLQEKDRSEADYEALNQRLDWQAANPERGLTFVPIDLDNAKILIFADGSFANNRDMSSQIGFLVTMVNEESSKEGSFEATGNILHWQSSKCKRVTRSVLASEIYGMTTGFDHGITLASTLRMITKRLKKPDIPVVICTDSYSLYECLVKLGTTKEKRLMIDLMALRQSYERHEIDEIRWIHGDDNPADAFTKANPNKALETFVSTNKMRIRVEGFVERTKQEQGSD